MRISWNPDDKLKKGNHNLYAEPNKKSRILSRIPAESGVALVGCDGKWAKVQFGKKTGWIAPEAQCTNTRTNCS
jgi:SH3-like domain-containing protein